MKPNVLQNQGAMVEGEAKPQADHLPPRPHGRLPRSPQSPQVSAQENFRLPAKPGKTLEKRGNALPGGGPAGARHRSKPNLTPRLHAKHDPRAEPDWFDAISVHEYTFRLPAWTCCSCGGRAGRYRGLAMAIRFGWTVGEPFLNLRRVANRCCTHHSFRNDSHERRPS